MILFKGAKNKASKPGLIYRIGFSVQQLYRAYIISWKEKGSKGGRAREVETTLESRYSINTRAPFPGRFTVSGMGFSEGPLK